MPFPWSTVIGAIPWGDVVRAAPDVLRRAKRLLSRAETESSGEPIVGATAQSDGQGAQVDARIRALSAEVASLREGQRQSTGLIRVLAEQQEGLIAAVEQQRRRIRRLSILALLLGAALVGLLLARLMH